MTNTIRTLLTDLVDYAGLFPPAKLAMGPAAEEYNRSRVGEHEWMLGRFICPVSRLPEFTKHAGSLLPGTHATSGYREHAGEPWRLSVLVESGPGEAFEQQLDAIDEFNERHENEDQGLALIDMAEIKVAEVNQIDAFLDQMPEGLYPFFEFPVAASSDGSTPPQGDFRGFITALAGNPAGAKIRTGGVQPSAFPTTQEVAAFLHACHLANVPFKATAGLHHPCRAAYRLTYEPASPTHVMHGFLNLFVAAALVRAGKADERIAARILNEEDPSAFKFSEEVLGWREYLMGVMDLARVRETFAHSFGSCSFSEPVDDLRKLGLL